MHGGTYLDYVPTNRPPHRLWARAPENVEVFLARMPERPFVETGILETQQVSLYSTEGLPEMVQRMRVLAGQIGCEGLVITGSNDAVTSLGRTVDTLKGYRASCIAFTDVEGEPAPAAMPAVLPAAAIAASPAQPAPADPALDKMNEGKPCQPLPGMANVYRCPGSLVCQEGLCTASQRK